MGRRGADPFGAGIQQALRVGGSGDGCLSAGDGAGGGCRFCSGRCSSCPGALVIGAPIVNVAGIGGGAKEGVLLKGGDSIDVFAKTDIFVFDKTGTLTQGKPSVRALHAYGMEAAEALTYGEALTPVRVCLIPRNAFLDLLNRYPSISLKLLEVMNRRLQTLTRQTVLDSGSQVKKRLIRYFLDLSTAQESQSVTLSLRGKELAQFLGTTPETLSRRWTQMEKEGLIKKKGKQVYLKEPERLEEI